MRLQIYFRFFLEKDMKNLAPKIEEKDCLSLKKKFCVLKAFGNNSTSVNVMNISIAQVCLLEVSRESFFIL